MASVRGMRCLKHLLLDYHAVACAEFITNKRGGEDTQTNTAECNYHSQQIARRLKLSAAKRGGETDEKTASIKQYLDDPLWDETVKLLASSDSPGSQKMAQVLRVLKSNDVCSCIEKAEIGELLDLPDKEPKRKRARVAVDPVAAADPVVVVANPTENISDYANPDIYAKLWVDQRSSVGVMYEALAKHGGVLLGDTMGSGKTVQTLTVLDTLQRRKADSGSFRALIVCPTSVMKTWSEEAKSWETQAIRHYNKRKSLDVMFEKNAIVVISYKMLTLHQNKTPLTGSIDAIVCDEAHMMKNTETQIYKAIASIGAGYRILLTGTPISNTLADLHTLIGYVAVDYLGTLDNFNQEFADKIRRGREKNAKKADRAIAIRREDRLCAKLKEVLVRRTKTISLKVPKHEFIVMLRMTDAQRDEYATVARSFARSGRKDTITFINKMIDVSIHPVLLKDEEPTLTVENIFLSAKLEFVHAILLEAVEKEDKVLLVSRHLNALDLMQQLCKLLGYSCLRLDGKIAVNERQEIITNFNDPKRPEKVFLLSSKAGGCGIELWGANRLIMFDADFSPANDHQAMARIHRGLQKKPCYIYRPFTACSIDETMLRRQEYKMVLNNVLPSNGPKQKGLFAEQDTTVSPIRPTAIQHLSETHYLMQCRRCCDGMQVEKPRRKSNGLEGYNHTTQVEKHMIKDQLLRSLWEKLPTFATFVYHRVLEASD